MWSAPTRPPRHHGRRGQSCPVTSSQERRPRGCEQVRNDALVMDAGQRGPHRGWGHLGHPSDPAEEGPDLQDAWVGEQAAQPVGGEALQCGQSGSHRTPGSVPASAHRPSATSTRSSPVGLFLPMGRPPLPTAPHWGEDNV